MISICLVITSNPAERAEGEEKATAGGQQPTACTGLLPLLALPVRCLPSTPRRAAAQLRLLYTSLESRVRAF